MQSLRAQDVWLPAQLWLTYSTYVWHVLERSCSAGLGSAHSLTCFPLSSQTGGGSVKSAWR